MADDDFAKLLGVAILGGGALWLAAKAAENNEDRRQHFLSDLAAALAERGLEFVAATFGRMRGNQPVWTVTFHSPVARGLLRERVPIDRGAEPYGRETATRVARALPA